MKLIYVVEDHDVIRQGLKLYLESSGFKVLTFANLTTAKEAFATAQPDLLIQDVMLPDGDGFEFVEEIRKSSDVPVVFMTARVEEEDRVRGLELGADDYITKPFSPKELVLRIQAIFRRLEKSIPPINVENEKRHFVFTASGAKMDYNEYAHEIKVNEKPVFLTAAEWKVVTYLISSKDQISSRAKILEDCFDYQSDSYSRIVDTHIKNIRAKLGDYPWIETVRGNGYRFIGNKIEEFDR